MDIVKGFLQIKFESNITLLLLGLLHVVNNFLQNNSFVSSTPTWWKTTLVEENNSVKEGLKVVNKDVDYDFVHYVTG
jgi:hypothetical protein